MFTGIIEELGTVESVEHHPGSARLTIRSPHVLEGTEPGDSLAVNGCCLTVTEHDGQRWSADVVTTTLAATTLGTLAAGERVNLERCVRADGRLDGHIVQGHVDGLGQVVGREESDGVTLLRIALPPARVEAPDPGPDTPAGAGDEAGADAPAGLSRYVVAKGSLAVDGVSLTVAALAGEEVTIGLIPETLARTTLGRRGVGERVNLEVDVLAKYVEQQVRALLPAAAGHPAATATEARR